MSSDPCDLSICQRCGAEVELTDDDLLALSEEHDLTDPQTLVAGVLCPDCLADFLAWL